MTQVPWNKKYFAKVLTISGIFLAGALAYGLYDAHCESLVSPHLFIHDTKRVQRGYTLIAPYFINNKFDGGGEVQLLDANGHIAHSWKTQHQPLTTILKDSGNLLVSMTPSIDVTEYPSAGTTGILQELDWDGNVVWEHRDNKMTHDFEALPDGSIAYLRWSEAPLWFAYAVRGGSQSATTSVWTNEVVVINKEHEVLWSWRAHDHMNPSAYVLNPLIPKEDWAHINSIRYIEDNPLTHTPAFLLSVRHTSSILLVDAGTGAIIWESPQGMLALQHDATLLPNGNILTFDNGLFRKNPKPVLTSRVVEIDPRTNKVVWEYTGAPGEQTKFASSIMGAAQRLGNGNTLITLSTGGRIVEITPDKKIIWEYANEFRDEEQRAHILFRPRKYEAENTSWKSKVATPLLSGMCLKAKN
jgi:hypothetical protein